MDNLHQYLLDNVKIEIEKKFPSQKLIKRYKCAFYKETADEYFFFRPKVDGVAINFKIAETINVYIYTNFGVFTFNSKITGIGLKLLKIQKNQLYKRIQRRKNTRAEINKSAELEFIRNSTIIRCSARINNIGASGISIDTDEDFRGIDKINVIFELEKKKINAYAKIVEIRKYRKINHAKYKLSIQFISLNDHEIEHIIKQCIKYQLEARKKLQRGIYD